MKLNDVADIHIIDAPRLSKLSTFDTHHLTGDLSKFGELPLEDSFNARDTSKKTESYLQQEFLRNQRSNESGIEAYQALSAYEKEKLSYKQYND